MQCTLVSLLCFLFSVTVYSQEWEFIGGPNGEEFSGLTIAPNGTFFVISNGIYRSTNEGITWQRSGVDLPLPSKLITHNDGSVYLVTASGLWRSGDAGATWTNILPKSSSGADVVVTSQGTIAFLNGDSLFVSRDGGAAWSAIMPDDRMTGVYTDSIGTLYACGDGKSYRSTDQGMYWMRLLNGFPGRVEDMEFTSDGKAIIATRDLVCLSTDSGQTWTNVGSMNNNPSCQIAIDKNNTLYTTRHYGEILRSTNWGNTWTELSGEIKVPLRWNNIIWYKDRLLYFTKYELHSRATTGNDLQVLNLPNGHVLDLLQSSTGKFYALTRNGQGWVFENAAWRPIPGFVGVTAIAVDSIGSLLGMTASKFFSVLDNGSLSTSNVGIGSPSSALATNGASSVYSVTSEEGFFRSVDRGKIWTQLNIGMADTKLSAIAAGPDNIVFVGGSFRYYRSTDEGLSWQEPVFPFITESGVIRSMARSNELLVFGIDRTGVYFSTDMGITWENHSTGLALDTVFDLLFTLEGALLATTNSGVYRYWSSTKSWSAIYTGNINSKVLSIVQGKDGKLYIGTEGEGIYRTSQLFSTVEQRGLGSDDFTFYPNPATTKLKIHFKDVKTSVFSVSVYDLLGQRVVVTENDDELDVSRLPIGQYFLRMESDKKTRTLPLLIVR